MKKIQPAYVVVPLLLLIAFAFYWFELRPNEIRQKCNQVAWETNEVEKEREIINRQLLYNYAFTTCLNANGLGGVVLPNPLLR